MRHCLALAPVVVLVVACSTFESAPTAGVDAGADAGASADATGDVAADAAVDAGPFCTSSSASFCRDFDNVSTVDDGWTMPFTLGGGTVERDTTTWKSAPASFHSSVHASSSEIDAYLQRLFPTPSFGVMTLEMDVLMQKPVPAWTNDTDNVAIATIYFHQDAGDVNYDVNIYIARSSLSVSVELPGPDANNAATPLPLGRWVHVTMHVEIPTRPNPAVQLYLDGEKVLDHTFSAITLAKLDELRLNVGIQSYNPPEPAFDVHYDNVTLTGQ